MSKQCFFCKRSVSKGSCCSTCLSLIDGLIKTILKDAADNGVFQLALQDFLVAARDDKIMKDALVRVLTDEEFADQVEHGWEEWDS